MAAKIDLKKHGGRVKGAGDLPEPAAGYAAQTGMPKNAAPDVISAPRASKSGYGQNGFARASSLTPMDDFQQWRLAARGQHETSGRARERCRA